MVREDTSELGPLETLFLVLGDKTRLKLLALLADLPRSVGFLVESLGESQPKVSRHLAYMRQGGIVSTRRDGKWIYYGINWPTDAAARLILESVVSSLIAVRVDGKYVYLTQTPQERDEILGPIEPGSTPMVSDGDLIFGRMSPSEDLQDEDESYDAGNWDRDDIGINEGAFGDSEDLSPKDEMEIFLL